MRPPDAQRPPAAAPAGEQSVDMGGRQGAAYPHDPARCVTCADVQHRDVVADLWWSWGTPYREAVAA